jgi:DNA-3-methyladenine glycosylase I
MKDGSGRLFFVWGHYICQMKKEKIRCPWCLSTPLMMQYHDEEWGVPVHDDALHFEYIVLDSFQAGLSWSTILNKRENFRSAFDGFDPEKIAKYTGKRVEKLLTNPGIIRNRLKVQATVTNAKAFLSIQEEFGSFDNYIWQFTGGKVINNPWKTQKKLPPRSKISDRMSEDLYARGFKFVGSTICYAYMQAAGMVNDHLADCHTRKRGGR